MAFSSSLLLENGFLKVAPTSWKVRHAFYQHHRSFLHAYHLHPNHLRLLFKCIFSFSKPGRGLGLCISYIFVLRFYLST